MSLLCLVLLEPLLKSRRVGGSQSIPALSPIPGAKAHLPVLRDRSVPPFILSVLLQDYFLLALPEKLHVSAPRDKTLLSSHTPT